MKNSNNIPYNASRIATLLGLLLSVLALIVMSGWLLHIRVLVEFRIGFVAMVFNTALCFFLTGIALALPGLLKKSLPWAQAIIGAGIFVLCAISLTEQIFDQSFGVDLGFLHSWLHDGNNRLGRMAPNTAFGFMLIGSTLLLMNRIHNKWDAFALKTLTFFILTVGLTGLIGYSLAPDQLFGWARSARMAIPTAICMIVSAIGLWLSWHRATWYQTQTFFREDEKISFVGAAVLTVVTLTAGLTGFVFQQDILEHSLREKLHAALESRIVLFHTIVEQLTINTANASKQPSLAPLIERLSTTPSDAVARKQINVQVKNLLDTGFTAIALYDLNGNQISSSGQFHHTAQIAAELQGSLPSKLVWDGNFSLESEAPILANGVAVGKLVTEQAVNSLPSKIFDIYGLGKTGEVAICISETASLLCFPEGLNSTAYRVKRHSSSGQPLPMSFAVDGQSGLVATLDYHEKNVLAAYSPLALEVGMVVKEDTAELYSVIRDQLKSVVPALLLLVLFGIIFLRSQLKPLTLKLVKLERTANDKEQEIKAVMSSVGEGIVVIDQDGAIESFNAAASEIFGYTVDEAIGQKLQMLMPPEMRNPHEKGMHRYLSGDTPHVIGKRGVELPGLRKNGATFPLELTVNEIQSDKRRIFVGIVRDITERKQIEEKLAFLAQNDALTGLPNRSLFMDRLSSAILRANRNQSGLAIMFLDLDGFKQVNDTLGHHGGDDLLKQFAARLNNAVRKTDTVARLAGDEFTIILEALTQIDSGAQIVANKIIETMLVPFCIGEQSRIVTTSIGIAIHALGNIDAIDLLARADTAMYDAKHSGKNRWSITHQESA